MSLKANFQESPPLQPSGGPSHAAGRLRVPINFTRMQSHGVPHWIWVNFGLHTLFALRSKLGSLFRRQGPYWDLVDFLFHFAEQPVGFYQISTTKKTNKYRPNYLKYRPHSTISTKYRPQKFLKKRVVTHFAPKVQMFIRAGLPRRYMKNKVLVHIFILLHFMAE